MISKQSHAKYGQEHGFTWLHFSDLHIGQKGQDRLFPRFQSNLSSDLETLFQRVAKPFDLVIFSGDLVQKGLADEFSQFDETLDRVLGEIERFQDRPKILTVPGNHDLVRPAALDPMSIAIKQYWRDESLQEAFWGDEGESYRRFIADNFSNYTEWRRSAINRGVHVEPYSDGIFPGDASYRLKIRNRQLGVVALNSAWLQISGSDYIGELHVDTHQLLAITDQDPDKWSRENDACLLVTHHPTSWLREQGVSSWSNDIDPPSRFDAHLFGHMHKHETESRSRGGSQPRRTLQAASLFGLEKHSGGYDRIHGYAATSIAFTETVRTITSWPRILVDTSAGAKKFVPDNSQDIDESTSSYSINYSSVNQVSLERRGNIDFPEGKTVKDLAPRTSVDLSQFNFNIGEERAHLRIRRVEQERFSQSLKEKGVVWLASDWGMGETGFLSAVRVRMGISADKVFRFDFSGYDSRESFFADLQSKAGCTFQSVCDAISDVGAAIIVFADVRLDPFAAANSRASDIENLAQVVSDFASDAFVVITCSRSPKGVSFPVTELRPLDEADVATYVKDSELGDERYAKPEAVSKMFRHTDGIPNKIDIALRDLEIISIDDLIGTNTDLSPNAYSSTGIPTILKTAVDDLRCSDDQSNRRSYDLLLALSALPQGEQLTRIKRFLGVHPFGPIHARVLLERSLIETISLPALGAVAADSTNKNLVVPRYVREFVRDSTDESMAREIDRRALELYFGDSWAVGEISNSPTGRRVREALCDGYEINNASSIIIRSISRFIDDDAQKDIVSVVRLGLAFIAMLIKGDHFRSASLLCDDMLSSIRHRGGLEREVSLLLYHSGRSLRMNSRHQEALAAFDDIETQFLDKDQRQHRELCIALTHQMLGDEDAAVRHANMAIDFNKKSADSLQAETIIASFIKDRKKRSDVMKGLLAEAEKRKLITVANNIRINLSREVKAIGVSAEELLRATVRDSRKGSDFYNGFRAIIDLAAELGDSPSFSAADKDFLVDAYHFLYNERMFDLFDRCHDELWKLFERSGDRGNLIRLFRHSSFMWRLRGEEEKEVKYLQKVAHRMTDIVGIEVFRADRDTAYVVVRFAAIIGSSISKQ